MATSKVAEKPSFMPDERQRQAIEHVHGPMLVVAGAGTGKTTVLIRRIARLIREEGVHPENILATTYTENAARETASSTSDGNGGGQSYVMSRLYSRLISRL